jgi:flagellar basal-body rod protein FlgF/flagellar basal-body rod protein FlgG
MNTGLYAACAGLLARTQALDLAANNLANATTGGYRAQMPTFRSVLAGGETSQASAVSEFGTLSGARLDPKPGAIERTGNDLDFAIQGNGYFVVRTATGARLYTRSGSFHVDRAGQLVTSDGSLVLGKAGPIVLPRGKVSVSSGGIVSVDGALSGEMLVVNFPPGTELTPQGASLLSAPPGSERVSPDPQVLQAALEGSNVNAISAAVGLLGLQRNADMLQRALGIFHSEFNRIAAQDLAKV